MEHKEQEALKGSIHAGTVLAALLRCEWSNC